MRGMPGEMGGHAVSQPCCAAVRNSALSFGFRSINTAVWSWPAALRLLRRATALNLIGPAILDAASAAMDSSGPSRRPVKRQKVE